MKGKIKLTIIVITVLGFLLTPFLSFAHPGNTDSLGCHTCRTNCTSWGLYYGEYHCHNPKPYIPTVPTCPSMSYYDSLSDSCKCYSGYVVSGGSCISADQYCRDLLGFNSRHNILTGNCECSYGYVISSGRCVDGDTLCHNKYGYHSSYNSSTNSCECDYDYVFNATDQCVERDELCQDQYGYNSEYNSLGGSCKCRSGYVFNSTMTKCIDGDSYCQDGYGFYSSYNSLSKTCECDYGYEFKNNQCIRKENKAIYIPVVPNSQPQINTEPKPEPITKPEPKPKDNNTETEQLKKCDTGYMLSFDKKHCIQIPKNAHAVNSSTDLWLCNDGYKEANSQCILVEKKEVQEQEENKNPENVEQAKSRGVILKFLASALNSIGNFSKNLFKFLIKK